MVLVLREKHIYIYTHINIYITHFEIQSYYFGGKNKNTIVAPKNFL